MPIRDMILPEFDYEMATTRKFLQCVPEDKLDWQPHAKSATLGWLANHLAMLPVWIVSILTTESIDLAGYERPQALTTREEILAAFDKNVADARAAIAQASDEDFQHLWSLLAGGQTIFTMPRLGSLRIMVLSHNIHHRGQLGLYFRLNDLPVPQAYGPTADEPM